MAADDSPNPFKGRILNPPPPMRVLHRFTQPGGHWAETRERKVAKYPTLDFLVLIDNALSESQMFHGAR